MKKLFYLTLISTFLFPQERSFEAKKLNAHIEIDGLLDEAWQSVESHTDFIQWEPTPSTPASKKTEFRFSYDEDNVYLYVKSYDDPSDIITQTGKRDNAAFGGDWVYVALSPLNDNNTGYSFLLNPSNIQADARLYDDGNEDFNWDAIWYSAAVIEDDGWAAEFRIPLRVLKFQSEDIQDWGFNMIRFMRKNQEKVFWEELNPDYGYKISRFAKIRNLEGLKTKNEINIIPSIVGAFDSGLDYDPTRSNRNLGLDLSYNFDEQHSILATIKPDFAQIEADADQINLSDYPLFLREKRPFFLKGNDLYRLPDENYYSRRMARPEAGAKFFGSTGKFKYGLTYVLNEGRAFDDNDNELKNTEHFILPRVKYLHSKKFELGYFGGYLNASHENFTGAIHVADLTYRPNDQFRFVTMAATTKTDNFDEGNSSLRFQMNYNTDTWYSYFRFQKKTKFFEQGLVGFPEPNNTTEQNFNLGRKFRFKNSHLRDIRFNININHQGSYDNRLQRFNYNFNAHANHQFKSIGRIDYGGGVSANDGEFRFYVDDSLAQQSDNYGGFTGKDNHGINGWAYFSTDYSKMFAFDINPWGGRSRGYDEFGTSLNFRIKPNNDLILNFNLSYNEIENSKFFDYDGIYRTYTFRAEYTLMESLYAKVFTQFNPQADRLSNNVILTYEYERGSFLYFAYTETGIIEEGYQKGSILKDYNLSNRTFSLKWTYSLYL